MNQSMYKSFRRRHPLLRAIPGDGMQLQERFSQTHSALMGNGISTFQFTPARFTCAARNRGQVSGFQVHFGARRVTSPGDYCDVLVAMNPAALKANRRWLKAGTTVIIDGDSLTETNLRKAGFTTDDRSRNWDSTVTTSSCPASRP